MKDLANRISTGKLFEAELPEIETTVARLIEDRPWLRTELAREFRAAAIEHGASIRRAQAVFESVRLHPYRGARDFLNSLQKTGAFELYIVSEGQPDTQWLKIRRTGLSDFVRRERLLTTSDAANPEQTIADLGVERARLHKELERIDSELQKVSDGRERLAVLIDRMAGELKVIASNIDAEAIILGIDNNCRAKLCRRVRSPGAAPTALDEERGRLADLQSKLEAEQARVNHQLRATEFVVKVLERMSAKRNRLFYAAVVRSILRSQTRPLDKLRVSFRDLLDVCGEEQVHPMKLAIIGDRMDHDIEPSQFVIGTEKLLTIHLQSEKYHAKGPVDSNCQADFRAYTLAQAKAILMSKSSWQDKCCTTDPLLFDYTVDYKAGRGLEYDLDIRHPRVGVSLLVSGITAMPGSVTYDVCLAVLCEFLNRKNAHVGDLIDRLDTPSKLLEEDLWVIGEHQRNLARLRIIVVCALIKSRVLSSWADLSGSVDKVGEYLLNDCTALLDAKENPNYRDALKRVKETLQSLKNSGYPGYENVGFKTKAESILGQLSEVN